MSPQIETERLILRRYTASDAQTLYEAKHISHPELRLWMFWAQELPTINEAQADIQRFHQREANGTEIPLAITLKETGDYIGSTGYSPKVKEVPSFEVGYWLSTPYTDKGYMHEAVRALTSHLFNGLDANRVEIRCHAENIRSASVARRLKFMEEGLFHNKRRHVDGTLADERIFAHTPQSWQSFLQS